jgi:Putative prokaryotic signal transducing protein
VDVHAGPGDDGPVKLVRVFESLDPIRGMLVRGLLEAEGLDVLAKGEGLGPYRTGPVILSVPEDAADRARELIEAAEDGSLALAPDELSPGPAGGLAVERSAD